MAKIVIDGTPYELAENITGRESKLAKRVSGISIWQLGDAWDDDRTACALFHATVAFKRTNEQLSDAQIEALLLDRPIDKIVFDFTDEIEEEAEVPTEAVEEDGEPTLPPSDDSTTATSETSTTP